MTLSRAVVALALFATSTLATTLTARAALPDPTLLRRQNVPSCNAFGNIESSCSIATPGFSSLDFVAQARCLCYQSSTFAPTVFDGAFNQCLSYYKTASPSFYSTDLGGTTAVTAPCSLNAAQITSTSSVSLASSALSSAASQGSSSAAAGSATITSAASGSDVYHVACTSWEAIQDACSTSTPGFGGLPFSDEASCLCYVGTRWSPLIYDGYWSSCLHYVQTYNGTLYSQLQTAGLAIPTPCQAAGNVRQSTTSSFSAMTSISSSSATARSTSAATTTSSSARNDGNVVNGATSGWITKVIGAVMVALAV